MERVQTGCSVTIRYGLTTLLPDGERKPHPEETVEFIFGVGVQAPTLENALEGARVGDQLSVHLPAAEIFGAHDPSLIREIPTRGLIRQRLKKGQFYRQMKMGTLVSFKVLELKAGSVLADFNRPMAGIAADLTVEVLGLREASESEIEAARTAQLKRTIGCG